MPKKKVISMLEFLKTGTFGGFEIGSSMDDFVLQFGKPLYSKENDDFTGKLVYEDVDIYTFLKSRKVWGIVFWGFRKSDEQGSFPMENKKFRIDPWKLRYEYGLLKTKNALDSESLKFSQIPAHPSTGYETLRLASGIEIILTEEYVKNRSNDSPINLVYDAILKLEPKILTEVTDG
jgi:hypothetical protein